jgi:protein-S-isoprenylcysteine O-methyltransferase Ste14
MELVFAYAVSALMTLSVLSICIAVLVDFLRYDRQGGVKRGQRSIVATGTMFGFYFVYYLVIRFGLGRVAFFNIPLILTGTAMVITGAVLNIVGRLQLKGNWANHIRIYDGHTLIRSGLYGIVRHPLYASLMLMLFGGSLVYRNWLSAVLTALVFIPFMYYRARQEEALLSEEFADYAEYRRSTGMFFPKFWRWV